MEENIKNTRGCLHCLDTILWSFSATSFGARTSMIVSADAAWEVILLKTPDKWNTPEYSATSHSCWMEPSFVRSMSSKVISQRLPCRALKASISCRMRVALLLTITTCRAPFLTSHFTSCFPRAPAPPTKRRVPSNNARISLVHLGKIALRFASTRRVCTTRLLAISISRAGVFLTTRKELRSNGNISVA